MSDYQDINCQVCGKPACSASQDVKETSPVTGKDGIQYATWEAIGPAHYFCQEHFAPGRVWVDFPDKGLILAKQVKTVNSETGQTESRWAELGKP